MVSSTLFSNYLNDSIERSIFPYLEAADKSLHKKKNSYIMFILMVLYYYTIIIMVN